MKLKILLFILLVSTSCTTQDIEDDKIKNCMYGCIAGIHHNGTDFLIVDINDTNTVSNIIECEEFCNLMILYDNRGTYKQIK